MARPKRPTGDEATNARKRYYRAAERHLKNARKLTGVSAERERKLAELQFENALNTYDPETTQKISKPMQRLANEFGINIEQRRRELSHMPEKLREYRKEQMQQRRSELIEEEESGKAKASNLSDVEKRKEYEAQVLLGNQNIMHRILGGLVDIWNIPANRDDKGNLKRERIIPTLFEHYNVNTMSELLEAIEKDVGGMLYGANKDEIYDTVKLTLQLKNPQVA